MDASKRQGRRPGMGKGRLEAFSDGVVAIIITIMVLELKVPHGSSPAALAPLLPVLLSYVLSFVYVGIYWNNHHHMLAVCRRVSGGVLWANLHLLFWLSLFPFATAWMGEKHFAAAPTAAYGVVLLMAAVAYWLLQRTLVRLQGDDSVLMRAIGSDWKGKLSPVLYALGIASTVWAAWIAQALYAAVAVMWLVPDRRIEGLVGSDQDG
ncbi:TMEM175 family protein [Frateuria sp. GZRe14]|uniref:TMEM175 family protein n=1 Tax=Frateuria sp. GZRe14 TaxID=3351534 RepID=UPI003EDC8223